MESLNSQLNKEVLVKDWTKPKCSGIRCSLHLLAVELQFFLMKSPKITYLEPGILKEVFDNLEGLKEETSKDVYDLSNWF